ncbi:hypothetical protein V6N12_046543 [Hibiscus sabdariffa]|uniref:Uncharacterized protein n=1 Tax=Hibiscus sabdariffa TaxID=183260 RepID=A0ABR2DIY2_9ROSI
MNAVHVRNQKHELTPPRNRDKPVTQQDALPNSEVPAKIIRPGRTRCLLAEASPLSSCQGRLLKQANPRGQLFELDPEIGRTGRELRLRARVIMQGANGRNLADGEEQGHPGQNPPAPAGHAIAPPQNNQQPPARTVRDYLAEDLEGLNPTITTPEFEA